MCGIFGFTTLPDSAFEVSNIPGLLNQLLIRSESRGKDACGIALIDQNSINVLKRPIRATRIIRTREYQTLLHDYVLNARPTIAAMGHARMVTNGDSNCHQNNQPVIVNDMVCLHNGIIVNDADLWTDMPEKQRRMEVDTEVFLNLIEHFQAQGMELPAAFAQAFTLLQGANTVALFHANINALLLATSNGSLYIAQDNHQQSFIFGSEAYIVRQVLRHQSVAHLFEGSTIRQISPNTAYALSLDDMSLQPIPLDQPITTASLHVPHCPQARHINDHNDYAIEQSTPKVAHGFSNTYGQNDTFIQRIHDSVATLRRCTRCLLPESFPFIEFDDDGVCNYCHIYKSNPFQGRDALEQRISALRTTNKKQNCLVPVSGGRDSSYGLHYIKNVLGLNPVAYTYDWGLVTDLARRNISRMCGELGVEHILISANIRRKRENVRKSIQAWLRRPELGLVPLFMAGDKQFFYYANMLKQQMDLDMVLFSVNPLERTDFKVGLTGINEIKRKQKIYYALSFADRIRMLAYYGKHFVANPGYINTSLLDSFGAFISYYMIPKDYEILYHYIPWEETEIERVLLNEYDWETATDTDSTWRIGDGTAAFYNYIYYVMAGFTEFDTFCSNQIREGMISREEGMRRIIKNNQPRYESIRWYAHIIGFDFEDALKAINQAPKRYELL